MTVDWSKTTRNAPLRFAIIGGGIYGCHIALEMSRNPDISITLFDKECELFSGASGWGDTRIHNGSKYLRNKNTRQMLALEKDIFSEKYSHLYVRDEDVENEIQMITRDTSSLLDFGAFLDLYSLIDTETDIDKISLTYAELHERFGFSHVEGGVFLGLPSSIKMYVDKSRKWFHDMLARRDNIRLKLNKEITEIENAPLAEDANSTPRAIIDGNPFDYVIDCTYNQAFPITSAANFEDAQPIFEAGFSLIFAERRNHGIEKPFMPFSIYDGDFPGMTPFNIDDISNSKFSEFRGRKLYVGASGRLVKTYQFHSSKDAQQMVRAKQKEADIRFEKNHLFYTNDDCEFDLDVKKVIDATELYYPPLMQRFDCIYKYWWIKSIFRSGTAARPVIVQRHLDHPQLISVFSSKISTVIKAERDLFNLIMQDV